jgi:hypothetical protein
MLWIDLIARTIDVFPTASRASGFVTPSHSAYETVYTGDLAQPNPLLSIVDTALSPLVSMELNLYSHSTKLTALSRNVTCMAFDMFLPSNFHIVF